jgi:hypothetical protein
MRVADEIDRGQVNAAKCGRDFRAAATTALGRAGFMQVRSLASRAPEKSGSGSVLIAVLLISAGRQPA